MSADNNKMTPEEMFLKTVIEGQYQSVDLGDIPDGKPLWFDKNKFNAGRDCVMNYYGGVLFSHFVSLIMMVFSPQGMKPLIFTGRSQNPKITYRRYIKTTVYVSSWYRGADIFHPQSLARQSLQKVRNYHSKTAEAVNDTENQLGLHNVTSSWCNKPLHQGRSLCPVINKDFGAIIDSKFLNLLHENYKTINPTSPNSIAFFNQVKID